MRGQSHLRRRRRDACRPNRRLSLVTSKATLSSPPNIAVQESAENRAAVSLRLPHADRPRSLRIECESTRFRAAHDAALRENRVAPRRPSTQVCCLAWRHSQILLLQLRHLPDLVDLQARILSSPTIERLFADPGLPDHLPHRNTYLCLHQALRSSVPR